MNINNFEKLKTLLSVMRATSEGRTILKEMTNLKIIDKV
jgi:hypothetical protein